MQAIIQTGGKQYKVVTGDQLNIEKIEADIGDTIEFDQVLLVADEQQTTFGRPYVEGAKVQAIVTDQSRGKKINILKFKRRKHHMKRMGHRQYYTRVEINNITTASDTNS